MRWRRRLPRRHPLQKCRRHADDDATCKMRLRKAPRPGRWYQRGLEFGCMFSIDPDAHSASELDHVRWGVSLARKGGLEAGRILNCLGVKDFSKVLERRKAAVPGAKKPRRSLARASS